MASDQNDSASGPGDYTQALTRLKTRLGQMRDADGDPYDALGPSSHPAADLARLAVLCGRGTGGDIPAAQSDTLPGPATINVLAEKFGFEVIWEAMSPDALQPGDLPAVVLLRNRTSRLVVGRPSPDLFRLHGPDGEYDAAAKPLAKLATGTVFRLRDLAREATASAGDAIAQSAAPQPQPVPVAPALMMSAPSAATPAAALTPQAAPSFAGLVPVLQTALAGQKLRVLHLCIASFLINLIGMTLPLFSMAVFDRVIPHSAFETLWALALGVTLALMLELMLRHARLKLFDAVGQTSSFTLQGRLVSRILFSRAGDVPKAAANVLPTAAELDQSALLAPQLLVSIAVDLPFFLLIMLFIGSIGGPIVFAPLVGTLLLVLIHIAAHLFAKKSHRMHLGEQRRQMQQVVDSVAGAERIRLTNAGETFLAGWEKAADKAGYSAHLGRYWHGMAAQAGAVIVQAVIVATIVWGAFRIQDAAMTIGALSAAILLVNRAMMPVSILTGLIFRAVQLAEGLAQAAPLMGAPAERAGDRTGSPMTAIAGRIDLHRVSLVYPGEQRAALRDITLTIRPGERIGLIGKAGCGKSTLLRLLVRLSEPQDGRILIDERDIRQFDPGILRNAIALMPQDSALFDASLYDNLTTGLGPVAQAQFERVVRLSGVQDFAGNHPSGYGMPVGAGGHRLSGGERQSVSLARALMGQPRVLLLDEPTSAMDTALEARIIAELKKTGANPADRMGLIIATHRLPVLALVDRVIWLDQGRVVADGPKDQVFAKLGIAA